MARTIPKRLSARRIERGPEMFVEVMRSTVPRRGGLLLRGLAAGSPGEGEGMRRRSGRSRPRRATPSRQCTGSMKRLHAGWLEHRNFGASGSERAPDRTESIDIRPATGVSLLLRAEPAPARGCALPGRLSAENLRGRTGLRTGSAEREPAASLTVCHRRSGPHRRGVAPGRRAGSRGRSISQTGAALQDHRLAEGRLRQRTENALPVVRLVLSCPVDQLLQVQVGLRDYLSWRRASRGRGLR